MKLIQAVIAGYTNPITVFSHYDEELNKLGIDKVVAYRPKRFKDSVIITNDPKIERDALFTEDNLQDAIEAYFAMVSGIASDAKTFRLVFGDNTQNANPNQSIEKDGINTSGQRYRIASDITSARIATLATCWYANNTLININTVLSFGAEIIKMENKEHFGIGAFNRGDIYTI